MKTKRIKSHSKSKSGINIRGRRNQNQNNNNNNNNKNSKNQQNINKQNNQQHQYNQYTQNNHQNSSYSRHKKQSLSLSQGAHNSTHNVILQPLTIQTNNNHNNNYNNPSPSASISTSHTKNSKSLFYPKIRLDTTVSLSSDYHQQNHSPSASYSFSENNYSTTTNPDNFTIVEPQTLSHYNHNHNHHQQQKRSYVHHHLLYDKNRPQSTPTTKTFKFDAHNNNNNNNNNNNKPHHPEMINTQISSVVGVPIPITNSQSNGVTPTNALNITNHTQQMTNVILPSPASQISTISAISTQEKYQQLAPELSTTQMTPTPSPSAPNFDVPLLTASASPLNLHSSQSTANMIVPEDYNLDLSNTDSNNSTTPQHPQMYQQQQYHHHIHHQQHDQQQQQQQQQRNTFKRYRSKSHKNALKDDVDQEMKNNFRQRKQIEYARHHLINNNNNNNNNNHNNHKHRKKNVKIGQTTMHPYRVHHYQHGHNNNNNNYNNDIKHDNNVLKATQSQPHNISYGVGECNNNMQLLDKPPTQSIKSIGSAYSMETQNSMSRSFGGSNNGTNGGGGIMTGSYGYIDDDDQKININNVPQNYGNYTPPKMTTATTTGNPNIKVDISGNFGVLKDGNTARDRLKNIKIKLTPTTSTPMKSPNHHNNHLHHNSYSNVTWQTYIGHFVFHEHDRGHSLYHQFKKIGEGVFARVYKTQRKEPQRTVALKVFPV